MNLNVKKQKVRNHKLKPRHNEKITQHQRHL